MGSAAPGPAFPGVLMLLLLGLLVCVSPTGAPPAPPDEGAAAALTPMNLEARMRASLRAQEEELAAPPILGAVGPRAGCGVATALRAPGQRLGLVVLCGGEVYRAGPLKPWMVEEVVETFLMDVSGDGGAEIVVVATYVSGVGPDGLEPFTSTAVLAFDGASFTHLEDAEARAGALAEPEAVRAALTRR